MHTLEVYRHFRFNLGVGLLGEVPTVLECPPQRSVRASYFIVAVGLWGVVSLESDLGNIENLVKIEASDWSRA